MRRLSLLALVLSFLGGLCVSGSARAQEPPDRITFGDDAVVAEGERVHDVVTLGGAATIDGDVTGDVVTMGGDAVVRGHVEGDVVTMGGELVLVGGVVDGEVVTAGGSMGAPAGGVPIVHVAAHRPQVRVALPDGPHAALLGVLASLAGAGSSLLRHALLFLLALLLAGFAPERFGAVQTAIVRDATRVGLLGLGAAAGACVAIAALALTIIGLPASVALAVTLALAGYVGLAGVAGVVGAALPVAWVHGKPVRELAAGCLALWLASLVPVAGTFALLVAGVVGLGAVVHTRFGKLAPPPGAPLGAGPFRTAAQ